MDNENDPVTAIKALAEMTFVFFRHCVVLGASIAEAEAMTEAYLEALMKK